MRPSGDVIHAFYQTADSKGFNNKNFPQVQEIRLHLANGEQRLPLGGFALFVLNAENGNIKVDDRRLSVLGWVIIRGVPRVPGASFRMQIDGKRYELYIAFRHVQERLKKIDHNAHRMEFEVRATDLNQSALDLLLDKRILQKNKGDFDIEDLKAMLGGGPFSNADVAIFDCEGGFMGGLT